MNKEHIRMNAHHLIILHAMHTFTDHPNTVGTTPHDGLSNYNVNATNLTRESLYIWSTEVDLRHLNKYKVLH